MRQLWWIPGASFIAFGVLIFVYPQLLAIIVALAFIAIGAALLSFGQMFRHAVGRQSFGMYRVRTQDGWIDYR